MSATRHRGGTCRLVSGPPRPVCCEDVIASPDRRLSSLDEFRVTRTRSFDMDPFVNISFGKKVFRTRCFFVSSSTPPARNIFGAGAILAPPRRSSEPPSLRRLQRRALSCPPRPFNIYAHPTPAASPIQPSLLPASDAGPTSLPHSALLCLTQPSASARPPPDSPPGIEALRTVLYGHTFTRAHRGMPPRQTPSATF
ncbi:hypothetical protein B0H14DRAFT_2595731 [Mycena olivaceomarginata]|nr:hypothetical protein B0H14DRAFT_2595731 [Mycena olivaceomarginata]